MSKSMLTYKIEHPFVGVGSSAQNAEQFPKAPVVLEEESITKETNLDLLVRDLREEHGVHVRITLVLFEQNWSA